MHEKKDHSLAAIDLLSDLQPSDLAWVEGVCRWKSYSNQEQIIDRQSDSKDVFFVVKGKVRVVNYSLSGREITLDDMGEGSCFGELAALDGRPRSASVMALTDTLVATMPARQLIECVRRFPDVAVRVMMRLALVVRVSNERIMDLSTLGANNRVHAELLRLAEESKDGGNMGLISPIPVHNDMASRVSTTRETVARVLNSLARQDIVERQKDRLVIKDMDRLREMVEEVRGD